MSFVIKTRKNEQREIQKKGVILNFVSFCLRFRICYSVMNKVFVKVEYGNLQNIKSKTFKNHFQ
jgi:hypothetical protein